MRDYGDLCGQGGRIPMGLQALTAAEVQHLLRRVGFGHTPAEVAHFRGRSAADVVAEIVDRAPVAPLAPPNLDDEQQWIVRNEVVAWWVGRMQRARWTDLAGNTPSPLLEKMTLLWHGHFCSEFDKVDNMRAMWDQNQLFRTQGLGDFHDLCQAVAIDPAMLRYLDNDENVAGAEQENFARELMELFTMGVGNYSEGDVVSMAKAWTGHNNYGWDPVAEEMDLRYRFYPDRHDNSNKTLFGIRRRWDGPETVTEIVRGSKRQATAEFIATKAWRFFAGPEPTPQIKADLAAAFIASNMNVKELIRAVLLHPVFWEGSVRYALLKSPVEFVVSVLNHLDFDLTPGQIQWSMGTMGQSLFDPPNVGGWGRNGYWLSTATMWARADFISGNRWNLSQTGALDFLENQTAEQGVQSLLEMFAITNSTASTVDEMERWFRQAQNNHRWSIGVSGVLMTAMLPEFQVI